MIFLTHQVSISLAKQKSKLIVQQKERKKYEIKDVFKARKIQEEEKTGSQVHRNTGLQENKKTGNQKKIEPKIANNDNF